MLRKIQSNSPSEVINDSPLVSLQLKTQPLQMRYVVYDRQNPTFGLPCQNPSPESHSAANFPTHNNKTVWWCHFGGFVTRETYYKLLNEVVLRLPQFLRVRLNQNLKGGLVLKWGENGRGYLARRKSFFRPN